MDRSHNTNHLLSHHLKAQNMINRVDKCPVTNTVKTASDIKKEIIKIIMSEQPGSSLSYDIESSPRKQSLLSLPLMNNDEGDKDSFAITKYIHCHFFVKFISAP